MLKDSINNKGLSLDAKNTINNIIDFVTVMFAHEKSLSKDYCWEPAILPTENGGAQIVFQSLNIKRLVFYVNNDGALESTLTLYHSDGSSITESFYVLADLKKMLLKLY